MFKKIESISNIDKVLFDACRRQQGLGSWDYYNALENSESLSYKNGWQCRFLQLKNEFVPMFLKMNSSDDFSYDQDVARQYEMEVGKKYYPKLQICIPFVPLEGTKFNVELILPIQAWAKEQGVSSLHVTLPDEFEYDSLVQAGFIFSNASLCYWKNRNYGSFGDFLGTLKSKYRSQIVQERKTITKNGYTSDRFTSKYITGDHVDQFYDLFSLTHQRKGWVMSKLTRNFFHQFSKSNSDQVVYTFIYKHNEVVAASCCFIEKDLLCGRFWGSATDEHFLHFEVMYYLPIEFCIQNQMANMEIGFEKPHKVIRGFVPKAAKSFHYFFDESFRAKAQKFFPSATATSKNVYR